MKLKKINITHFRHLRNVEFDFGNIITIIAGGNGTGKTSLLGMIGHVYKFGSNPKNLLGDKFETKYSSVFKFSEEFDVIHKYQYSVAFENNVTRNSALRIIRDGTKTRHRIDVGGRVRGGGKIKRPVIFQSLKRLIPVASEATIKFGQEAFPDALKDEFNQIYNTIFASEEIIAPLHTKSANKKSFSPTTKSFDVYGISAGQDNIGQIILSLLSFRHLKNQDPTNYNGGLLIIDELDATLYPAAQKNLMLEFFRIGRELDLQIIFTTHSSDILNFLTSIKASRLKHSTNFVGLTNASGNVEVKQGYNELNKILADLNHDAVRTIQPKKINFYFEDNEALIFYKSIIGTIDIGCEPVFKNLSLSSGTYKKLIDLGFEEFYRSIIVLDGDFKNVLDEQDDNTIVFLPGDLRPENIIDEFLNSLDETDTFWQNEMQYFKRVYRQNKIGVNDNRESMKIWFKNELQFWGTEGTQVFERWEESNPEEVSRIIGRTRSIVKRINENYFELSYR